MRNSRFTFSAKSFVTPTTMVMFTVVTGVISNLPHSLAQEPTQELASQTPTFGEHVLPILRKNCVACHHSKLAEGGLNLESLEAILQGGDSGAAVSKDQPESSLIVGRANGTVDDIMPPEDNGVGAERLTAEELEVIVAWIRGGMPVGTMLQAVPPDSWQDLPPTLRSIYSVASSPDGSLVAVGRGNTLHLLGAKSGVKIQDLVDEGLTTIGAQSDSPRAHLDFVNAIAFDPQGRWLASGGFRTIKLWKRQDQPAVTHATFAQADESIKQKLVANLVVALGGGTAETGLNPSEPGNLVEGIDLAGQTISKLFAASKIPYAIATMSDGQTRLIDLGQKKLGGTLAVSPASVLAISSAERTVNRQKQHAEFVAGLIPGLEEALKKEDEALAKVQKTKDDAAAALETKKGELAAAEGELKTAQEATEPPTEQAKIDELTKKRDEVQKATSAAETALASAQQALAAATDARAQSLASLEKVRQESEAEKVLLAEVEETLKGLRETQPVVAPTVVASHGPADGQGMIALGMADGTITLVSNPTGVALGTLSGGPPNPSRLIFLDSEWLLSVSVSQESADPPQWSVWRLTPMWHLDQTIGSPLETSPLSDRITAIDFSPDGRWLVAGSGQPSRVGEVTLIDLDTMQIHATWDRLHSDTVLSVRISPDGRRLASAGADRQIRIVDFPSGENQRSLEGHTHHVLGLAWHDNARRLASVSADHTVKVWDTRNVQAERTINAGNKELAGVSFVGTTSQIAICSGGGAVWLYNTDNGSQVRAYQGVSGFQMALTTDQNGQWLAAGGDTGNLRIWPIESPQPSVSWPATP